MLGHPTGGRDKLKEIKSDNLTFACLDEENAFVKKLRKRKRHPSWDGGRQAASNKKSKIYSDDLKDMCLMLCMICGKTLSHGSLKVC